MIWLILAGLIVLLAGVAFGRLIGFRETLIVLGWSGALLVAGLALVVLFMQGSYEMGWCEAQKCRVW